MEGLAAGWLEEFLEAALPSSLSVGKPIPECAAVSDSTSCFDRPSSYEHLAPVTWSVPCVIYSPLCSIFSCYRN
jgi:hypothetical protein